MTSPAIRRKAARATVVNNIFEGSWKELVIHDFFCLFVHFTFMRYSLMKSVAGIVSFESTIGKPIVGTSIILVTDIVSGIISIAGGMGMPVVTNSTVSSTGCSVYPSAHSRSR